MAAPILQVDHLQNGFNGGRWIFLPVELTGDFSARADIAGLVRTLVEQAAQGAESLRCGRVCRSAYRVSRWKSKSSGMDLEKARRILV